MCPFTIDETKMQAPSFAQLRQGESNQLLSLDPAKPPVKSIPHYHFPLAVYKHPKEPFLTILHRNAKHEVVQEEFLPAEHLTKVVSCREHENGGMKSCEACQKELKKALNDGWVQEPYIPQAPPDPNAHVYDAKSKPEPKSA